MRVEDVLGDAVGQLDVARADLALGLADREGLVALLDAERLDDGDHRRMLEHLVALGLAEVAAEGVDEGVEETRRDLLLEHGVHRAHLTLGHQPGAGEDGPQVAALLVLDVVAAHHRRQGREGGLGRRQLAQDRIGAVAAVQDDGRRGDAVDGLGLVHDISPVDVSDGVSPGFILRHRFRLHNVQ